MADISLAKLIPLIIATPFLFGVLMTIGVRLLECTSGFLQEIITFAGLLVMAGGFIAYVIMLLYGIIQYIGG